MCRPSCSAFGYGCHACVIALAILSACPSTSAQDASGGSLNDIIDGIKAYDDSWSRFSVEYEGRTENRTSETGEWRPHAVFFGGLERYDRELNKWRYSANNAAPLPNVMVAAYDCFRTIDETQVIFVKRRFSSPPPDILTKPSVSETDFGEVVEDTATLRGPNSSSQFHSILVTVFPFLALGDQQIVTDLQEYRTAIRPVRVIRGGAACFRLKWRNKSGERTLEVADKLGFTPVFFDERVDNAQGSSALGKPIARMRTTWQLLPNPDPAHRIATWSREQHFTHTDGSVYQERTRLQLENTLRPIDKIGPLKSPPKNGQRVVLYEHQQISAEWRDGAIVRTYDGKAVERLAQVEFEPPSRRGRTAMFVLAVGCITGSAMFFWLRNRNATSKRGKKAATVVLFALMAAPRCSLAVDPQYCGVLAIYGAASSLGQNANFESLLEPEFIGNIAGSSLADLEKAARRIGVYTTPFWHLSLRSLQFAQDPMILHVASPGQLEVYNHWQLFLGTSPDGARIVDHDGRLQHIAWPELLARWDGIALAVHSQPHSLGNYTALESAVIGWWCVVGCLGAAASGWAMGNVANRSAFRFLRVPALVWLLLLCALSFGISSLRQFGTGVGAVFGTPVLHYVLAATKPPVWQLATPQQIESANQNPDDAIVIDARRPADFDLGHIPGAISIPVEISDAELRSATKDWPRNRITICYCQSERCEFDDILAVRLVGLGFVNVRLWKPGWVGWQEHCEFPDNRGVLGASLKT